MVLERYKIVFCTPVLYSAGGVERVVTVKTSCFSELLDYDVTIIVTEGKREIVSLLITDKVRSINYELSFEELWRLPFFRKVIAYICKQRRFKKKLKADLMSIRPDFTVSILRCVINFLNELKTAASRLVNSM